MLPEAHRCFQSSFDVSRETIERLSIYEALLREWSSSLSLVGRTTLDNVWNRHFLDSAQLLPILVKNQTKSRAMLDIGTGAGFPGMVLAIIGTPHIHLAENNQQKIRFLETVATQTGTVVSIHNCKAEALGHLEFEIVTARAVAPLSKLMMMASAHFAKGAMGLFLKGRSAMNEVAEAREHWNFELETTQSITSPESSILRLSRIKPKR